MDLADLYNSIEAVCPITAVSVGDESDRSTWRITFDDSATNAQRSAARAALSAWVSPPPDCQSLAFWLTALDLWERADDTGTTAPASSQVQSKISALVSSGNPLGVLASRQLNNTNTVIRQDLYKIAPAFGFTKADCDESLWRADRVANGDLSGQWPVKAT